MTIEDLLKKTFEEITYFRNDEGDFLLCIGSGIFKLDLSSVTQNEIIFKALISSEIHNFINLKMKFEQIGGEE